MNNIFILQRARARKRGNGNEGGNILFSRKRENRGSFHFITVVTSDRVQYICISEATERKICKYHDVVEYLNISSRRDLLLYTIPKKNWKEPLDVGLDFTLVSILSVQEKLQVVTFYFWLNVVWTNEFISWDPSAFCNISVVLLPSNLFWIPDIFIDERADEDKYVPVPFVEVFSTGKIKIVQPHRLTSSCSLDVHSFPFDEQMCNLSFVPTSTLGQVNFKNIKTFKETNQDSRKNYLSSGEWKFEKVDIVEEMGHEHDTFYNVTVYQIFMKRRSILNELVLILPTFIMFLLDMAISCAFASPAEEIAFKVTLILQVSLLSLILNDKLTATTDNPPVIAMFFTGIFVFMVLGILENALVVYLKEQRPKFLSSKTKNFMSQLFKKGKGKKEDSVSDVGNEILMENRQSKELPLPENDTGDNLVFLKQLTGELQQIRKHLALEEGQENPGSTKEDKKWLVVENWLYYIRLFLSLIFIIYIIIQWAS